MVLEGVTVVMLLMAVVVAVTKIMNMVLDQDKLIILLRIINRNKDMETMLMAMEKSVVDIVVVEKKDMLHMVKVDMKDMVHMVGRKKRRKKEELVLISKMSMKELLIFM
jgi:hypothetical protein